MGAWGMTTFENDNASDWLYELEESTDLSVIQEALNVDEEYIESSKGCNVLAAAEIILALLGKPRSGLPENAKEWVGNNPLDPSPLIPSAIKAVSQVLGNESELKELWGETDESENWENDVKDILNKLKGS